MTAAMAGCAFSLAAFGAAAQSQQEWRVAAVVNGEPITGMDLSNRTRLMVFATGLPATAEVMNRYTPQVLNTLVDEALQRQEAEAQNVTVRDAEVEAVLTDMERRNNLAPGSLEEFLASKGVDKGALEAQIRTSLLWAKLVKRRLEPQVEIGDQEIDERLRRITESQGKPQHLVAEIFLAVDDSASEERVRETALRIIEQIRTGASFEALARAFSQSATAASGGDLGWLRQGELDDELERVLAKMPPGGLAGPVRAPDGYHILYLRDRQLPGASVADRVTVDLRQISVPVAPSAPESEVRAALAAAEEIRARIGECAALEGTPLPGKATVANFGRVRVSDLAEPLAKTVMRLDSNQLSPPLRTQEGIALFMVCERDAAPEALPEREQIRAQLAREKLDLLARRYLRDLRRAAFLDIRV